MKHKNALCLAMVCLSAGLCFGQFNPWVPTDNVMPNNGCDNDPQTYPRWFYPDDVITLQYCNRFLGNDNQWHPMPYTPYFLSSYTTRTSGYHTHETFTNHRNGPGFLGNGYGPGVQSFSPTHGIV